MAVTLSDAQLSAGMMLTGATGSTLDTPPEPYPGQDSAVQGCSDRDDQRAAQRRYTRRHSQ